MDVILDHPERELDYTTLKLAGERGVFVDVSVLPLITERGMRRMRFIEKGRDVMRVVKKFETPFLLTSGAKAWHMMRSPKDLMTLATLYGIEENIAIKGISDYPERLIRKKLDKSFILDGLEVKN